MTDTAVIFKIYLLYQLYLNYILLARCNSDASGADIPPRSTFLKFCKLHSYNFIEIDIYSLHIYFTLYSQT